MVLDLCVRMVAIGQLGTALLVQGLGTSDWAQATDSLAVRSTAIGIIAADNARVLSRVLTYYAPDAVLLSPGETPVTGREQIQPRYEALFASYDPAIDTFIDELRVVGNVAYVRGRNGGLLRGRGDMPARALNDVYLMLLRRAASGPWQITHLIWHSAGPPPAPRP
jgi:uncharacterized protein (TIGR02246 family)